MTNPYESGSVPESDDLWSVDPNDVADAWLQRHEPLSHAELSDIASSFVRSVGEPARKESDDGAVEDQHLRVADGTTFGRFAQREDVALLEPADTVEPEYGYLYGYTPNANTAEETGVPLLICLPGPLSDAAAWLEGFSAAVAQTPRFGLIRP